MSNTVQAGGGLVILAGAGALAVAIGACSLFAFPSWTAMALTYLLSLIALFIFVTVRHIQLLGNRKPVKSPKSFRGSGRQRPQDYYLFVLGSGGHTKEMLMMMDDGFCDFRDFHRRYLISSGDRMSENHLEDYEADLATLCAAQKLDPGTYDKCVVARARRVHQPLWSTPFTALLSILDIFPVLLSAPASGAGRRLGRPTHVVSNGPATGFFVGMAVHVLKMFYVVPEQSMKFVYVESWARISTLSLTGKLLHYTGMADIFLVQHAEVAAKYGIENGGEMVFNSRRPESAGTANAALGSL